MICGLDFNGEMPVFVSVFEVLKTWKRFWHTWNYRQENKLKCCMNKKMKTRVYIEWITKLTFQYISYIHKSYRYTGENIVKELYLSLT